MNQLKQEIEKRIFLILQHRNNSSLIKNDELEQLIKLYKELNKSNYKNITFTDLIPSVFFICITSILITVVIKIL